MFDEEISKQDVLSLIALASKTCLLIEQDFKIESGMERMQLRAAADQVRPILAKIDKAFPGLIPIPHDGVTWKERVKDE